MNEEKFIVYRHYSNSMFWTYERLELSEKNLKKYIVKHQNEMKNIEVFRKSEIVEINVNVDVRIKERR